MSELKKCPFCGGEADLFGGGNVNWVRCRKCPADMKTSETKERAAAAWNRRAKPENASRECHAMERVEGGIPYCSDKQTACDGCKNTQPENEPHTNNALTRDELYHLDGEPLYVMDGEGHECYCVVNTKNEDCIDNEAGAWCFEFYDMTGDGKHGLHKMGWRAYRTKPERSEG